MEPEPKIERMQKALDRDGGHDWPHVVDLLEKGDCQIFDSDQGVWITEIKNAPKGKALNVWLVAGSLPGVMELQPEVEAFATANGCRKLTAGVRRGWKKTAEAHGWKVVGLVIEKELTHE